MTAIADALLQAGVAPPSTEKKTPIRKRKSGTLKLNAGRGDHKPARPPRKPMASKPAQKPTARPDAPQSKPKKPKHRPATREKATALTAELAERFPKTFGTTYVPLAKGIYHDIRAATGAAGKVVDCALLWRCLDERYHKAVARPGAERHELGGRPVEPVSDEDQAHSRKVLASMARKRKRPAGKRKHEPRTGKRPVETTRYALLFTRFAGMSNN